MRGKRCEILIDLVDTRRMIVPVELIVVRARGSRVGAREEYLSVVLLSDSRKVKGVRRRVVIYERWRGGDWRSVGNRNCREGGRDSMRWMRNGRRLRGTEEFSLFGIGQIRG